MCYSLTDLESENKKNREWFILFCCLRWNRDSIWGGFVGFVVILSAIWKSKEVVLVRETPGLGGGTMSVRCFLVFWKR